MVKHSFRICSILKSMWIFFHNYFIHHLDREKKKTKRRARNRLVYICLPCCSLYRNEFFTLTLLTSHIVFLLQMFVIYILCATMVRFFCSCLSNHFRVVQNHHNSIFNFHSGAIKELSKCNSLSDISHLLSLFTF